MLLCHTLLHKSIYIPFTHHPRIHLSHPHMHLSHPRMHRTYTCAYHTIHTHIIPTHTYYTPHTPVTPPHAPITPTLHLYLHLHLSHPPHALITPTHISHISQMLLCDECDKECHMYCQYPVLWSVPDGKWICPLCREVCGVCVCVLSGRPQTSMSGRTCQTCTQCSGASQMGSGSALSVGRFVVCVCVCCLGGHRHPCLGGHVRLVPSALEHILDGKWICPLCREVCGVVCVCSLGGHRCPLVGSQMCGVHACMTTGTMIAHFQVQCSTIQLQL